MPDDVAARRGSPSFRHQVSMLRAEIGDGPTEEQFALAKERRLASVTITPAGAAAIREITIEDLRQARREQQRKPYYRRLVRRCERIASSRRVFVSATRPRIISARAPRSRRTGSRARARAPGRSTGAGDGEPEPLDDRRVHRGPRPLAIAIAAELERLAELAPDPLTRRQALELAAAAQRAGEERSS